MGGLDAHLDAVLIGGREAVRVRIADYDPGGPARFSVENRRIRAALGDLPLRVDHLGSTAVPGLTAKSIIDVLVTVPDPEAESSFVPRLQAAGYELRVREQGHRMFRTAQRDVHVHVWADQDPEVERYLRFRDQLRRSPSDRAAYEQLKRSLAERDWSDMNHYADAKSRLVEEILARGLHFI
jgi:GrpB-like predicted nucleotidyltransferase (UPF0157 family)